ncbi:MAG TPA: beta-ketoacyl synthase N-terminal-like domain-containing protein [Candidatus Binatia bacterium]|nr:beta-ketoacyl synthase N-terminal-like domain-containing protein [Candidatus Binatia bacterium]
MRDAYVLGVGMTRFGKHLERSMKSLAAEAITAALEDAGVPRDDLEAAFVGNAVQGLISGQECVRGQVVLRECGIGRIPVINVENACASASTALHLAWQSVAGGFRDCALAVGMEKLFHPDKARSFAAFTGAVDVELLEALKAMLAARPSKAASGDEGGPAGANGGGPRSLFMDVYAAAARHHMQVYGTRAEHFAAIAAKNSFHGSLNPRAQYQQARTVEEVLASPVIAAPLTRLMCSPIGDGAAAAIVVSSDRLAALRRRGVALPPPVRIAASVLGSGRDRAAGEPSIVTEVAREAYEVAGIGPEDVDVAEMHDATAPAELMLYEELGLCAEGEGKRLVESGETRLGGRRPVNVSGGLIAKGHPVGATGLAQVVELVDQLRGRAGRRQVAGARVALAENAGGAVRAEPAAIAVHVLVA